MLTKKEFFIVVMLGLKLTAGAVYVEAAAGLPPEHLGSLNQENGTAAIRPMGEFIPSVALRGFQAGKVIENNRFTVHVEKGIDIGELSMKLALPAALRSILREPLAGASADDLPARLNHIYLAVSEIMDVSIKYFQVNVVICKNSESLSGMSERLFKKKIKAGGFYVVSLNTLYVDGENVDLNILGHEISHAIQAHYFVLPPPAKIQEVLAGFVEYEMRKYSVNALQ